MRSKILLVLLLGAAAAGVPVALGYGVRCEIESRLELGELSGRLVPVAFLPAFYLKSASFRWRERAALESGDLRVDYDPLRLFRGLLRLRVSGKDLQVRLLGDWAKSQGVESVKLDSLESDVEFDSKGLSDIYFVDARSSAFQFHVKKSENNTKQSAENPR